MCDADDSDSQCAKGCVMHDFDEDASVITEDEKPDENEEFAQYTEISFDLEFTLDHGSTLKFVANQISGDLKSVYHKINPFDQAVTTVDVSIEDVERCMSSEDLSLQPEDVFHGEDCDPEADKWRKRKSTDNFKKVTMKKLTAGITFTGEEADSVTISSAGMIKLSYSIHDAIKKFGKIEYLSDEQLCDHIATYTGVARSYLSKAISNSAEFMKLKPIKTKKPEGNTNFYLHSWMGSLKDNVKDLPLSMLAIPGSHNSASYNLDWKFTWAPNSAPFIKDYNDLFYWETMQYEFSLERDLYLNEVFKFYGLNYHLGQPLYAGWNRWDPANAFKYFEAWNTCLRSNTKEQLMLGIRYFDYK